MEISRRTKICYLTSLFSDVGPEADDQNQFPFGKLSRNDESLQTATDLYKIGRYEKSLRKIHQLYTGLYIYIEANGIVAGNIRLTRKRARVSNLSPLSSHLNSANKLKIFKL